MKENIWLTNVNILEAFSVTHHGHYTHVYSVHSYWQKYRKKYLPNKEYISVN